VKAIRFAVVILLLASVSFAQDQFKTGTGLGVERVRIAVADFKDGGNAAQFKTTFDTTLFNDLNNAGIFDVVSKSFNPIQTPGSPQELQLASWANAPVNAAMLAFGTVSVQGSDLAVQGYLFDTKNAQNPQVLGKQYRESASDDNARLIAHKFADEIVFRLGGGIPGIFESKIVFISSRTGNKEVWIMDYDGANQKQLTHLGAIALSPRISPDGSKVAFTNLGNNGAQIAVYSLDLHRPLAMPKFAGTNSSPAWSPDGSQIAFSSSMRGDPEIFVMSASGGNPRRLTAFHGPDVSPVFNAKTGAQIAWVSGKTKLPQISLMEADGTNPQQLTDGGFAVSPSWSPNGQFLAFAWTRHYGPGAPGGLDLYLMDIASRQWVQLTHGQGSNDFPSWSPDGRHIVFERSGKIWTMLADGTQAHALTSSGRDYQPNWSWH
jgi:TolB protein